MFYESVLVKILVGKSPFVELIAALDVQVISNVEFSWMCLHIYETNWCQVFHIGMNKLFTYE